MTFFKSSKFFLLVAVLTLLAASVSVQKRIAAENANKNVLLVAEADMIRSLAGSQGLTIDAALNNLEKDGLNGIVIPEETINELLDDGKAQLSGVSIQQGGTMSSMTFSDDATAQRVIRGLTIRFGKLVQSNSLREGKLALPPVDAETLRSTSVGLNPELAAIVQKHHLTIVGRFSNPVGISNAAIGETLKWAKDMGTKIFLPQGDQVLGRRSGLDTMKQGLISNDMLYASPEFAKLGGDQEMLTAMPDHVVRLHSAQEVELDKLSPSGALDRYLKAAKERDMRVLLLRSLTQASDSPLTDFGSFVGLVSDGLGKKGLALGEPVPFSDPNVPKPVKVLIGLFGGIAALWVAVKMFGERRGFVLGGLALVAATAGAGMHGTGLEVSALLLSMVFPIGAYYWLKESKPTALLALLGLALISMIGGFCVAGLLNSVAYYIRAETFSGVKISVFLPILIIGLVSFADFNDLKKSLADPISWGTAGLSIVILSILVVIMMRTGNDNPNTVSGGELAARGFLEEIMPVRPRSKEFLMGFPALLVGLFILDRAKYDRAKLGGFSGWVSLCIMLGFVGLTDSVNTLCHLHTPVMVSVLRDIIGLIVGGILGLIAWGVLKRPIVAKMGNTSG